MQTRLITCLMILIVLTVAAVTAAQIFWMYNAYKLQDETFKSNALKSVKQATENIENFYGCFEVFNKVELDKNEKIIILLRKNADEDIPDTIKQFSTSFHKDYLIPYEAHLPFTTTAEIFIKYHYNPVDTGSDFSLLNKHNYLKKIIKTKKDSVFSGKLPVTYFKGENYFNEFLDSVLNFYLNENGISSQYFFYLKNERENKYILGNVDQDFESNTEVFTANLYENSFFFAPQKLYLWLPEKEFFLFGSMKYVLIGSLVVLLVLISVAYLMSSTILKQKKLSQIKKDFINNMTHEFKTPIANIALAIDTIDNLKLLNGNHKINSYLKMIGDENLRLSANVEKILEISELEEENIQFIWEEFSLNLLIEEIAGSYELSLKEKGGKIYFTKESDHFTLKADRTHISNMINNLIDNALKYNKSIPFVSINLSKNNEMIKITITDNGLGMSANELENIFTPFYRISTGNLHDVKGFGLGLSYVKKVVKIHGGTIKVESESGKGTVFIIQLPYNLNKKENY